MVNRFLIENTVSKEFCIVDNIEFEFFVEPGILNNIERLGRIKTNNYKALKKVFNDGVLKDKNDVRKKNSKIGVYILEPDETKIPLINLFCAFIYDRNEEDEEFKILFDWQFIYCDTDFGFELGSKYKKAEKLSKQLTEQNHKRKLWCH